jgi:hypothetical protein
LVGVILPTARLCRLTYFGRRPDGTLTRMATRRSTNCSRITPVCFSKSLWATKSLHFCTSVLRTYRWHVFVLIISCRSGSGAGTGRGMAANLDIVKANGEDENRVFSCRNNTTFYAVFIPSAAMLEFRRHIKTPGLYESSFRGALFLTLGTISNMAFCDP